MRRLMVLGALVSLSGCGAASGLIGGGAGAAVGLATSAGTANPVVGTAAALGTKAAVDSLVDYIARRRQQGEQDAIIASVATLPIGGTGRWQVDHTLPYGNTKGELTITREIRTPLTICKEVAFTVEDGDDHPHYITTACQQGPIWKWAQAEPSTSRWGFLQ